MQDYNSGGDPEKLVPLLYRDAVSPAAKAVGDALGTASRAILAPSNFVFRSVEEAFQIAQEGAIRRLRSWATPPESLRTPPPEVADPVIRRLRNPAQNEELRERYLTLLARAMDSRFPEWAHPAFVEVLGQLSPEEAAALDWIRLADSELPLVMVQRETDVVGWVTIGKHFNLWIGHDPQRTALPAHGVDNLARLGIIRIDEGSFLLNNEDYDLIKQMPAVKAAADVAATDGVLHYTDYLAEVTAFGQRFLTACNSTVAAAAT